MYRHVELRPHCHHCGHEAPTQAMAGFDGDGYVCFRCLRHWEAPLPPRDLFGATLTRAMALPLLLLALLPLSALVYAYVQLSVDR